MASRWFCSEPWIECLSVYHSWWWCTFQVYSILTRMVGQKGVPGANLSPLRALVGFTLTLALEGTAYFRSNNPGCHGTKVTDTHRFGIYRLSCQVIPNCPAARQDHRETRLSQIFDRCFRLVRGSRKWHRPKRQRINGVEWNIHPALIDGFLTFQTLTRMVAASIWIAIWWWYFVMFPLFSMGEDLLFVWFHGLVLYNLFLKKTMVLWKLGSPRFWGWSSCSRLFYLICILCIYPISDTQRS